MIASVTGGLAAFVLGTLAVLPWLRRVPPPAVTADVPCEPCDAVTAHADHGDTSATCTHCGTTRPFEIEDHHG